MSDERRARERAAASLAVDRSALVLRGVLLTLLATSLLIATLAAQDADRRAVARLRAQVDELVEAKRHADAIPLAEDLLRICEKTLGVADRETIAARGQLAELHLAAGHFGPADALLRQGFAIHQKWNALTTTRGLLTGRAFWPQTERRPEPGYGSYSFLLFAARPRDSQERARHLKALEAYLLVLPSMVQLERHRPRSQLNAMLAPVVRAIELSDELLDEKLAAATAARLLEVYDYARAQVLLSDFGEDRLRSGPYLVSTVTFPPRPGAAATHMLLDLSHVVPTQVWDWTRTFCWLAAQERSWSQVALRKFLLNVRNALGIVDEDIALIVTRPG